MQDVTLALFRTRGYSEILKEDDALVWLDLTLDSTRNCPSSAGSVALISYTPNATLRVDRLGFGDTRIDRYRICELTRPMLPMLPRSKYLILCSLDKNRKKAMR